MKTSNLENISDYVTEKIELKNLNNKTYISTENILPNKAGVINATTLPNIKCTSAFQKGDVLVSNIRPYFKKIWRATFAGGCSNDVLVFRAKNGINNEFLYYILSDDKFFEYSMSTAKGTKMPRGDKNSLMKYEIPDFDFETQQKIAKVLSAIDDKIELNNSINNNLEQQAQAIFKSWFVDFEPFGGTMPDNWKSLTLGDVTENIRTRIGKNNYIVLSAVNTGKLQPSDEFFSKQVYSKNTEKYIKVDEGNFAYNPARINIGSIGINDLGYTGCVSPVYVAFSVEHHYESFFRFYFKSSIFKEETRTRASGSVRQSLNYTDFALIEINYPSTDIARKFNEIYNTFFKVKNDIEKENKSLIQLRDTLLPRLMSGEIDVSKVEIDNILENQSSDKLLFSEDK